LETALDSLAQPVQGQSAGGGRGGRAGGRGGGTSLYDAAMLASDEVMKKQSGRKAVIVLSDGVDNASKVSLMSAIEAAQRADTMIYAILFSDSHGYGAGPSVRMGGPGMGGRRGGGNRGGAGPRPGAQHPDGKKVLQQMARETGGGFFEVSSKQPIEKVFSQIQEELRSQYSLGYSSDKPEGSPGFRAIHLTAKGKDLVVQTRSGYYAEQ
jgi:VWFA-related protein